MTAPGAARVGGWGLRLLVAAAALECPLGLACSVGEGDGYVHSDQLFVNECYRGVFDLNPDFFGANPYGDTLTIRVQRGEQDVQVSDGLTLLVNDVPNARLRAGEELSIGLPKGLSPLGFPLPEVPSPPAASLSLYLNASCRSQNSLLTAFDGNVTFKQLFSGDPNEEDSFDRMTEGNLTARVVDTRYAVPRDASAGGASYDFPEERVSTISAGFRFVFHRGTPAQPFP
ncbi:MAG: hypothetical protein ABI895_04445 [Deltaproteobacteria bacterium]